MLVLLWLRRSLTILMSMPTLSASVAHVWRRPCRVIEGSASAGSDSVDVDHDHDLGCDRGCRRVQRGAGSPSRRRRSSQSVAFPISIRRAHPDGSGRSVRNVWAAVRFRPGDHDEAAWQMLTDWMATPGLDTHPEAPCQVGQYSRDYDAMAFTPILDVYADRAFASPGAP
jgi:hypothetical protein